MNALSIGKEIPIIAACVPWTPSPLWNLVSFFACSCYLIFLRWEDIFWHIFPFLKYLQYQEIESDVWHWCIWDAEKLWSRSTDVSLEEVRLWCLSVYVALVSELLKIGAGTDLTSPRSVFHTVKMYTWIRRVKLRQVWIIRCRDGNCWRMVKQQ